MKVIDGRVQKHLPHKQTPSYWTAPSSELAIDKEKPGSGYKHVLSKRDILDFIEIVPEWDALSCGLNAVLLAAGEKGVDGWHNPAGIIGLCAWDRGMWRKASAGYYEEHAALFDRIGVPCERVGNQFLCKFSVSSARAYMLLHVFLHELGHHWDMMTTAKQAHPARGEGFAEDWALAHEAALWGAYLDKFGLV